MKGKWTETTASTSVYDNRKIKKISGESDVSFFSEEIRFKFYQFRHSIYTV